MTLHWLPIAGTLCAFQGNPNPDPVTGETERAVVVGQVQPTANPLTGPEWYWRTATTWGWAPLQVDAQLAAEAAIGEVTK